MAQGEFWVERQNWARWPRVLKVNRHTDHGTETRRYLPERHEAAWNEREYAMGKIAELEAENAKLRKELSDVYTLHWHGLDCTECPWFDECGTMGSCPWLGILADHMRELGIEVPS